MHIKLGMDNERTPREAVTEALAVATRLQVTVVFSFDGIDCRIAPGEPDIEECARRLAAMAGVIVPPTFAY